MDIKTADLVIKNAQVYTVNEAQPRAEAVAIGDNKILYVGNDADIESYVGPDTRVIDGDGRTLMPGFIDSHFHLEWGAKALAAAQVELIEDLAEVGNIVRAWAAANPTQPWVQGFGLSYKFGEELGGLTRHHLDEIISDRPLILYGFDMHTTWLNTRALEMCGLLQGVEIDEGDADVVMGDDGLATGELIEPAAYELATAHIPEPSADEMRDILRHGLATCASLGITSVHNMDGDADQMARYHEAEKEGKLTLRVNMPFWVKPDMDRDIIAQAAAPLKSRYQSDLLRCSMIKFFIDGVFESFSAVTLNGYPEQPDNHGEPIFTRENFTHFAREADKQGFQIAVHACGDGGVRLILDGYEQVQQENGVRDSRHRIEHIELVAAEDIPRFAQLGVIASMQPLHAPLEENDPDIWPSRVAEEEWDRAFAWRSFREAGVHLAFGSDWPVVTLNPFLGLYAAVNRRPWKPGHNPHVQTLEEAIAGYTKDGAYAEFQEDVKGQIKVGMWADLVLLSEDVFAIPSEKLAEVEAMVTICDGKVVFERAA